MGLIRAQIVGEGMDIIGRGRNIQIRIAEILERGIGKSRVKFEIHGVPNVSELEISAQQPPKPLGGDVRIMICEGLSSDKEDVRINYSAPPDYRFQIVEYKS